MPACAARGKTGLCDISGVTVVALCLLMVDEIELRLCLEVHEQDARQLLQWTFGGVPGHRNSLVQRSIRWTGRLTVELGSVDGNPTKQRGAR